MVKKNFQSLSLTLLLISLMIFLTTSVKADPLCGNGICDYTLENLAVGQSTTFDAKTVTLVEVGSDGSINVKVDGVSKIISVNSFEVVNGIEITNYRRFYTTAEGGVSSATIVMRENAETCPEDCEGLTLTYTEVYTFCRDYQKSEQTNEELADCGGWCNRRCTDWDYCSSEKKDKNETDVDCGGPICIACKLSESCKEGRDCRSGRCYQDKCEEQCSEEIPTPYCKKRGAFLRSLGTDDKGCVIAYTCCADGVCSLNETEETCPWDCKSPLEEPGQEEEDSTGEPSQIEETGESQLEQEQQQETEGLEQTEEKQTFPRRIIKFIFNLFGIGG